MILVLYSIYFLKNLKHLLLCRDIIYYLDYMEGM